jgi:acyl transferase domain-containing protein
MHGTGTALGDPIEFGAAVAVIAAAHEGFARLSSTEDAGSGTGGGGGGIPLADFRRQSAPTPTPTLALSSIKASFGHSEAAAGAWGLIHAASQVHRRGGGQLPHLRTLNLHVAQVIHRRRESTPAAAAHRQDRAAAVSAPRHTGSGGGSGRGALTVCALNP